MKLICDKNVAARIMYRIFSIPRLLLVLYFKLDRWHRLPVGQKSYIKEVVRYLNKRETRNSVVEIGCGLCDILKQLKYKNRTGYDCSTPVVNAVNWMNIFRLKTWMINIKQFEFGVDSVVGKHDAVILCNWIHNVSQAKLNAGIRDIFVNNLTVEGVIVVDLCRSSGYKFKHTSDDIFSGLNGEICEFGSNHIDRRLVAIVNKRHDVRSAVI